VRFSIRWTAPPTWLTSFWFAVTCAFRPSIAEAVAARFFCASATKLREAAFKLSPLRLCANSPSVLAISFCLLSILAILAATSLEGAEVAAGADRIERLRPHDALLLPGAGEGLNALFTPKWSALLDYQVWMAAFGQIFFSLSVGFGIMLTYASYLQRRRSNLVGTGLVAGFANSSFELFAGIGVFATLGFMAHTQHVGISEMKITGPSLSFITFPTVISQMPGGALFGVLFFASFSMAGLTSFISIIQVVAAGVGEKLDLTPKKASLVVGVPAAVLSFVLFATSSGLPDLDVVDAFINNIGVVASAIIMCVVVAWLLRRTKLLQDHLNAVSESRMIGLWWRVLVGAVVPVLLGYMFIQTLWTYLSEGYESEAYSSGFVMVFGWGMLLVVALGTAVMSLIPWRTPVDEFEALTLEAASQEED